MTSFTSRYGNPAVDHKGAHVRAHFRHAATVVAIGGRIDASNVDLVAECVNRFVLNDKPFVLDLSGVSSFTPQSVRLLAEIDERCNAAGVDWAVVGSDVVMHRLRARNNDVLFPIVGSVAEAEHEFDDAILNRRRFLLPLLSKTA
ncbi:STAS domain-containing protein [Candidatus Mycolicibacterium alkanivorans]|uniref:STAS domain-containing protein n=1 Tax=Candidatus Mycolicibacterium alkanivorans TaxID=2954114 RepID=A0ABS9YX12_9MYCO|nr:STAS domain-containing protein [Candidatus Mycolicibacterium alkanivorans]MCI4675763.1 STAS domain-containing protein [Candidatus Mycolicibacterium alkanivorans]